MMLKMILTSRYMLRNILNDLINCDLLYSVAKPRHNMVLHLKTQALTFVPNAQNIRWLSLGCKEKCPLPRCQSAKSENTLNQKCLISQYIVFVGRLEKCERK